MNIGGEEKEYAEVRKATASFALAQFKQSGVDPDDFLNDLDDLSRELKRAVAEKQQQSELERLRLLVKTYEAREERVRSMMLRWLDMTKMTYLPIVVREAILSICSDYIKALEGKK